MATLDFYKSDGTQVKVSLADDPANPGQYLPKSNGDLLLGTPGTGEPAHAGGSTGLIGWARDILAKIAAFGTSSVPSADVVSVQYPNAYVGKATLGALNAALTVDTLGAAQIAFNAAQTTPGGFQVTFEGTNSNATTPIWTALRYVHEGSYMSPIYSAPGSGVLIAGYTCRVDCAGLTQVRVRCSAYSSGTCEVLAHRVYSPGLIPTVNEPSNTSSNGIYVSQLNGYAATAYGSQAEDTSTPLAAGTTFTSSARNTATGSIGSYTIDSISDQASAANGVKIQRSTNFTTWFDVWSGSATANTPLQQRVWVTTPYMRVTYTNGATLQTSFNITTAARVN